MLKFIARTLVLAFLFSASAALAAPNLPVEPWYGGPVYWNKFSAAAPHLADPSKVPVSIWYLSVRNQAEINLDKSAGITGYTVLNDDAALPLIRQSGMWAILQAPGFNTVSFPEGTETIGKNGGDEPDWKLGAPPLPGQTPGTWAGTMLLSTTMGGCTGGPCALDYLNKVAAKVPASQFLYLQMSRHSLTGQSNAADWYASGKVGLVSADLLAYSDCTLNRRQWAGRLMTNQYWNLPYSGTEDLQPQHVWYRAELYGRVVERLRTLSSNKIPVWVYVEVARGAGGCNLPEPTIEQIKGAVWAGFIFGASGVQLFDYHFLGPAPITATGHWLRTSAGAAMRPLLKAMFDEVQALAPVLNSPSYSWDFGDPKLNTRLSAFANGDGFIIAQPNWKTGTLAGTTHTLKLPPDYCNVSNVSVLYENRTLAVSNCRFTDSFASGDAFHRYRVALAAVPPPPPMPRN